MGGSWARYFQSPRKAGRWVEWGPGWKALRETVEDEGITRELGAGGLGETRVVKFLKEGEWALQSF